MIRTSLVAALAGAVLFAGCSGGASKSPSRTADSTTPAPRTELPTAVASPVPPPEKPATLAGYASVAAKYLSDNPSAAQGNCLADLYAAWGMPLIAADTGCLAANTDQDSDLEAVAAFSAELSTPGGVPATQFEIVVFDPSPDGYRVAYESPPSEVVPPGRASSITPLIDAGDLNNDGGGEFAYFTDMCGASTCTQTVHILKGTAAGYVSIAPSDGISMSSAEIRFLDTDGDGSKELLLTGGTVGSVGGGPQRPRTEAWAWNGAAYALRGTVFEPPTYLYHAIIDADALFVEDEYPNAEVAYVAAVDNESLLLWMPDKNERNELEAYALFHAGLAALNAGGDTARANGYFDRAKSYANTLHAQLAASFQAGFNAKASIAVGCAAVRDDLSANAAEYAAFWNFGYTNPVFDPAKVCPF